MYFLLFAPHLTGSLFPGGAAGALQALDFVWFLTLPAARKQRQQGQHRQ